MALDLVILACLWSWPYNNVLLTDDFSLHRYNRLSAPPETLDQLGDSLALLEQLQQDLSNIEAKFPPLHQQFAILEKYEVAIPEEVRRLIKQE